MEMFQTTQKSLTIITQQTTGNRRLTCVDLKQE